MTLKKYLEYAGEILYKAVEIPFNIIVGNYLPKAQELRKENKELREKTKNLGSQLVDILGTQIAETNLEIKRLNQIKEKTNFLRQAHEKFFPGRESRLAKCL